jgi:hypothetical protein
MVSGKPSLAPMVQPLPEGWVLVIQDEHKLACKKERDTKNCFYLFQPVYCTVQPQNLKRQVAKRLVSKRPVSKRQVYKTPDFKMSCF